MEAKAKDANAEHAAAKKQYKKEKQLVKQEKKEYKKQVKVAKKEYKKDKEAAKEEKKEYKKEKKAQKKILKKAEANLSCETSAYENADFSKGKPGTCKGCLIAADTGDGLPLCFYRTSHAKEACQAGEGK